MKNANSIRLTSVYGPSSDSFLEGPAVVGDRLYFSNLFAKKILTARIEGNALAHVQTFFTSTSPCNGLAVVPERDELIACVMGEATQSSKRELMEVDLKTGISRTLVSKTSKGKQINAPNDVAVDETGRIYFTDPDIPLPVGLNWKFKSAETGVYSLRHGEQRAELVHSFCKPNGIGVAGNKLFVVASGRNARLWKFELVGKDGSLKHLDDVSLGTNSGDGLALCPSRDIVLVAASKKLLCFRMSDFSRLGSGISMPDWRYKPSNVCFLDDKRFFVTANRPRLGYAGFVSRKGNGKIYFGQL